MYCEGVVGSVSHSSAVSKQKLLEWFGFEGTFKLIQLECPAMGRETSH